jgi:hypothetical protein
MQQSQVEKANITNRSFYKRNTIITQQIQKEEEAIKKKIDTANN